MTTMLRRYLPHLPHISEPELCKLRQNLFDESQVDVDYMVLCVAACAIASFGLLVNSTAVIIGAMIVAPLMTPMRGLALGALEGDWVLFRSSAISIGVGFWLSVGISGGLGLLSRVPSTEFGSEILARTQPTLIDLAIALAAGTIAGFAKIRPHVSDALAGTAIAVALMPPLCVVGLSLSQGNGNYARGALLLYTTNLLGITLACMVVFAIAGYYVQGSKITRALSSTLLLVGIIVIPLSFGLRNLARQVQLQATLRKTLINKTITVGRQTELIGTSIDWRTSPPTAYLNVRATQTNPLTPIQVYAVENLVAQEMQQQFTLVFRIENYAEVRSDDDLISPPRSVRSSIPSPAAEPPRTTTPAPPPDSPSPNLRSTPPPSLDFPSRPPDL
jgi:uncharacterized hydrophobic protein (TIGR00271 family)